MGNANFLVRLARIGRGKRVLLAEAAALLAIASFAVRCLPFRRAVRLGVVPVAAKLPDSSTTLDDVVWSIEAVGRRAPFRAVCIEQGIAGQRMLRRRGWPAVLHYGIAMAGGAVLKAHVWLAVGDRVVLGARNMPDFRCVATYPAEGE